MRKLQTVTGEISREEIGRCLMHEHAIFGYPGWQCSIAGYKYEEAMEYVSEILTECKDKYGLSTLIDATPSDCGRDVVFLKELSERTGINIVASTGCYYEGEGSTSYFKIRSVFGTAEEEIYQIMKKEITEGIGDTGIKAGVIKVASSEAEITPYEDMFLRAAGRVSGETGTRIITHTQSGKQGSEQARRLIEYGAKAENIMIGHLDGCNDIEELMDIFEQGVYGGYDRLGLENQAGVINESRRLALIAGLAMSGYSKRIMLSHDCIIWPLGEPWPIEGELVEAFKNWNVFHVFKDIIPRLKEMGFTDLVADAMVGTNAADFLCGE